MKRIISVILCIILLLISINCVNRILMDDRVYSKSYEFYENDNPEEYDVLFLGSSHITRTVIPMELWKNYGISSYNLGNVGQSKGIDYWMLKDALNRVTPKVVVIDIYPLGFDSKMNESNYYGFMHENFDLMPLSITKLQAFADLFDFDTTLQYLFPLEYFHINWENFNEFFEDSKLRKSVYKGVRLDVHDDNGNAMVALNNYPSQNRDNESLFSEDTISKTYLRKMIELCKNNNIEVLLMNAPFFETEDDMKWDNSARLIAEEYDIHFMNFCEMDEPINYLVDSYDGGSHLNSSGARKVTKLLGEYLKNNYSFVPHDDDFAYKWNDYYDLFLEQKVDDLKRQSVLDSYLMLLSDDDYDIFIDFNAEDINDSEIIVELFKNLGVDVGQLETESYVLIKSGGKEVTMCKHEELDKSPQNTVLGELSVAKSEEGISICLDGREFYCNSEPDIPKGVLRFSILDTNTHDLLDQSSIYYCEKIDNKIIR